MLILTLWPYILVVAIGFHGEFLIQAFDKLDSDSTFIEHAFM